MRRCYKCGAKMTTNYIVCPECEKKVEANIRKIEHYHYHYGKFDILKTLEKLIVAEHDKLYEKDTNDEWNQGEHYAYHRVLQMIADLTKGEAE